MVHLYQIFFFLALLLAFPFFFFKRQLLAPGNRWECTEPREKWLFSILIDDNEILFPVAYHNTMENQKFVEHIGSWSYILTNESRFDFS